jgi:hypothetical protein
MLLPSCHSQFLSFQFVSSQLVQKWPGIPILYGGKIFACRRCYRLAYESQTESPAYRALNRTQSIRMRLGGSGSMMDFFPEKPKGMHWKTYRRLEAQGGRYEQIANQSMMAWIGGQRAGFNRT